MTDFVDAVLRNCGIDPEELAKVELDPDKIEPGQHGAVAESYRLQAIASLKSLQNFLEIQITTLRLNPDDDVFMGQMLTAGGHSAAEFGRAFRRYRSLVEFRDGLMCAGSA